MCSMYINWIECFILVTTIIVCQNRIKFKIFKVQWLLYIPRGLTLKILPSSHIAHLCVSCGQIKNSDYFMYSIKSMALRAVKKCVYCAVRTEASSIIQITLWQWTAPTVNYQTSFSVIYFGVMFCILPTILQADFGMFQFKFLLQ